MSYETLIVTREDAVGLIRLNRPQKRNSITFQMMDELEAALAELSDGIETRAVIITGDDAAFSSGMDLNGLKDIGSPREFTAYMTRWRVLNKALEMCTRPVIAAIEGYCFTGGFELALACDIRVGAEGSSYAITSSKIGTVPGAGGTQRLPRIVGIPNALDILFSAEPVDAQRAHQMGVLQRLTPKGGRAERRPRAGARLRDTRAAEPAVQQARRLRRHADAAGRGAGIRGLHGQHDLQQQRQA
jgi:enoyl-CoA hydratase/carnithine racemase